MFESYAGAVQDEESKVYLRPETAQGIFLNFKNIIDTSAREGSLRRGSNRQEFSQ